MPDDTKVPFRWEHFPAADTKAAHALQHIAHYLDRIEGHLERIADAAEKQARKD